MATRTEHRGLFRAIGIAAVVLLVLLAVVLLAGRPADGVLPGVAVEGIDVGGMGEAELRDTVEGIAEQRIAQPVTVEAELGERTATRGAVGEIADTRATAAEAWNAGRGLVSGLPTRLRARFGATTDIPLESRTDESTAREFARAAAEDLSTPPQDGDVVLVTEGPDVEVVPPEAGEVVDGEDLGDRLVDALDTTGGPIELDAPSEPQEPVIGQADVDAVLPAARRAISAPVTLRNPAGGEDLTLSPADLARLLEVRRDDAAALGERLAIVAEGTALPDVVGPGALAAVQAEPVEATFAIQGEQVAIEGGTAGFALDAQEAVTRIRDLAVAQGDREGELPGDVVEPELTRADAEALGIQEQVATFTTSYTCCPPRVTNIQRMAELVTGAIIFPGDSFSLNDHVGPRTEAKGFVPGGVIQDGEFEEAVGGGISQFATTFFNTAFFTGIELVAFQPHSFYIERYPMGRESTIAFGLIDVVITNDSPHAILIAAAAGDTAVTVTFYSTPWADVDAFASEPYDVVPGDVRDGFTIDFGRTVTYPDGASASEEWTHTYQPEDDDEDDEDNADEDGGDDG